MQLETEFKWYLAHQAELVKRYEGKYIVIKGEVVLGAYENPVEARRETIRQGHAPGTFLIQLCKPGMENYTQTFHSRVAISS